MNFNEQPKQSFEPSQTQGPESGERRNFLKNILRGVVGVGAVGFLGHKAVESLSEDPTKESTKQNIASLMAEMEKKNLDSVPMVEISSNENILSDAGWVRLERILAAKGIKPSSPDDKMSFVQLKELLEGE